MNDLPRSHRLRAAAERIRFDPILDVGAGKGVFRELVGGRQYVGVDISVDSVGEKAGISRATVLDLPYDDGAFGSAVCIAVLQYVSDVRRALNELHRVVRPGGQVLIQVENFAYVRNITSFVRGRLPSGSKLQDGYGGTLHQFTWHDFHPLLLDSGFHVLSLACSGRFRGVRSLWPQRLGGDLLIDMQRV